MCIRDSYYAREEREPLKVFHFRPQLMDFERAEGQGFVEVLRPRSIYDLIDFSVRAVSYTHLDVYKRQVVVLSPLSWFFVMCILPPSNNSL